MARRRISGESTSDLYIRLGLSLDELESGFVDAQRTIRDNMSRLWRENTIIDLQARVELTGLDETADAEQILAIRTRALNEQIKNQKDRVRLATAELRNMTERTGENSDQTQRARIALEHHRLELARLEDQLNSLNEEEEDSPGILSRFMDAFDNFARQCWNVIGIVEVFGGAITELVDSFRELQTQAYELNMPVNDVKNFLRHMRLAGGDIGDFEGFIRGITDAYVKGEFDDPEFIALSKYGAKITDVTGRLKNFEEITEEVYQAYLKAKEAGEEIEFLQLVGGESGVRDAIQYFERYAEAKEDAEKIFDAGLDPDELHKADRALKLLVEQLGEFKDAVVNLGIEKATSAMQTLFEVVRSGTEALVDLNDALKTHGDTVRETFAYNDYLTLGLDPETFEKDVQNAKELRGELDETAKEMDKAAGSWAQFQQKMHGDSDDEPLSQYAAIRVKEFKDELAELRNELDNWDSEYLQSLGELELWRDNELNDKLHVSKDERIAIEKLYSAKLEQIERERADKLDEIREEIAASDRTALENKIASIEKEAEEWRSAGMEEAEAVELAEKKKNDAVTALEEEFTEAIAELHQNSLEKTLAAIEKEKQAWIQKGIDEVRATEWAEQKKADAQKNAALNVLKSQLKEWNAFKEGGYGGLQEYLKSQLLQAGVSLEDLKMTPAQLKAFNEAREMATRSLLPNFMTDSERAKNAEMEQAWLDSYRDRVNEIIGYAIGDDGKMSFLRRGAPHHFPYVEKGEGKDKKLELDKDRAYQLGLDARLEEYFGKDNLRNSLDGLNMGAELQEQFEAAKAKTSELTESLEPLTAQTSELSEATKSAVEEMQAVGNEDIGNVTEQFQDQIDAVTVKMTELVEPINEVTGQVASLAERMAEIGDPARQAPESQQPNVENNITNQITISEAHAWDSEHIQDLADKVADILSPRLVDVLGGDNNAY